MVDGAGLENQYPGLPGSGVQILLPPFGEEYPSGLRGRFAKPLAANSRRGFKSHLLRFSYPGIFSQQFFDRLSLACKPIKSGVNVSLGISYDVMNLH